MFGKNYLFQLIRTVVLLCSINVSCTLGQTQILENNARFASVVGGALSNADGMKRGDVLVVEDWFYDGWNKNIPGKGGTKRELRLSRIVFDFEEKRQVLQVSRTIHDWLNVSLADQADQGRSQKISEVIKLIDLDAVTWHERIDNRIREMDGKNVYKKGEEILFRPDPRTAGWGAHGLVHFPPIRTKILTFLTGEHFFDYNSFKDRIEVRFNSADAPSNVRVIDHFTLDPETNMPIAFQWYVESLDGSGKSQPLKAWFEWVQMENLHVPTKVRGINFDDYRDENDVIVTADVEFTIRFHWFSLNREIDEIMFDKQILKDSDRVQKLIDPRIAGATELVEFVDKFEAKKK